MGIIGKTFGIVMLPLSLLIILEQTNIYALKLPVDKIMIGAILMIALQLITLIMLKVTHGDLGFKDFLIFFAFSAPGGAYLALYFLGIAIPSYVPIALAVIMLTESLYALH